MSNQNKQRGGRVLNSRVRNPDHKKKTAANGENSSSSLSKRNIISRAKRQNDNPASRRNNSDISGLQAQFNDENEDDFGPEGYQPDHGQRTFTSAQAGPGDIGKEELRARALRIDFIDEQLGFNRYLGSNQERLGWLVNMQQTIIFDSEHLEGRSAVDLYFINETDELGPSFKATLFFRPYFLVIAREGTIGEIEESLNRRFPGTIDQIVYVVKEDLELVNHLSGAKRSVMQLFFRNTDDLNQIRKFLQPLAVRNEVNQKTKDGYASNLLALQGGCSNAAPRYDVGGEEEVGPTTKQSSGGSEVWNNVLGIREYDVPYLCRVAIDLDLRVGLWFSVQPKSDHVNELLIRPQPQLINRADPVVLAFDIETSKAPLKFPDPQVDVVMMISYMVDGQGFLITNRQIISQDIADFEYSPRPDLEGNFTIFNEKDEKSTLEKFFSHIRELKPTVIVTYNGDFFDWPFIDTRATKHGLNMRDFIGFSKDDQGEYRSSYCIHMDCFAWVKRDSYLPAGSHGLKAVTTAKLGYHPLELDPELMVQSAREEPQVLAQYSVSDAVATYYLYMKYVHPFIFSLCNVIPAPPDDVLRKGSGTLCEYLLMVQAYKANVLMPNKHKEEVGKLYNGHMLESETYVGGHVEALEAGVFRKDLPVPFHVQPDGIDTLINQLDDALKFSLRVEANVNLEDVENYAEIYTSIKTKLFNLRSDQPITTMPLIYHLDVAAMYPNIILTNRLQPDAIIDESTCASCDFNLHNKTCARPMTWSWRGEYYPAQSGDINMIKHQLKSEVFPGKKATDPTRPFSSLDSKEQDDLIKQRLNQYCRKVYGKVKETKVEERTSLVCQREHPFYIDTVRSFRDRRYDYKGLHKKWKKELEVASEQGDTNRMDEAKRLIIVYDSLQLAHKCILNSFYGYVMRKGSRWYSMEMGGIVCLTGARIIQMARQLIEKVGRPLELDTDGIWCILPYGFPENFTFKLRNGKSAFISYPCTMLNHLVHDQFTNHQYQNLSDPLTKKYSVRSENSIFFEVDGPYRAMILPASKEADKLLKKRYAVFNDDGSLAELKGFEIKRRGELKLIKIFQSQIFGQFLNGSSLKECYNEVAKVANQWLDILFNKGTTLKDRELFELISENRSMSKSLAEYGDQKSTSISTAKRLAEFLGSSMVKDKGLACQFIMSKYPVELPISERAIPTAIFSADLQIKNYYLRKWTKDPTLNDPDLRSLLDWDYYIERFGSVIQKLITIPAAMQRVSNPVPRVRHPEWLAKRIANRDDRFQQRRIDSMFTKVDKSTYFGSNNDTNDIEDIGMISTNGMMNKFGLVKRTKKISLEEQLSQLKSQQPLDQILLGVDRNQTYKYWLSLQKSKWKLSFQIKQQKIASKANLKRPYHANMGHNNLMNKRKHDQLRNTMPYLTQPFAVLQLLPVINQPGIFKLWIMVGPQMFNLSVNIPRQFYIDSKFPQLALDAQAIDQSANFQSKPANRSTKLPRSYPTHHLFEVSMDEWFYQQHLEDFSSLFTHANIFNCYETRLPLLTRGLLNLGCMANLDYTDPQVPSSSQVWQLHQINRESGHHLATYPQLIHQNLQFIVILHRRDQRREMVMVYTSANQRAQLYVQDGPKKPSPGLPSNLSGVFTQHYQAVNNDTNITRLLFNLEPPAISFEPVVYLSNSGGLWTRVNSFIATHRAQFRGPTMACLYSPQLGSQLIEQLGQMDEMPYLVVPSAPNGGDTDLVVQPLQWQLQFFNLLIDRLVYLEPWLVDHINWSSYGNLPLGNLDPANPTHHLLDQYLARYLVRDHHSLWWSDDQPGLPDLGGLELDRDHLLLTQFDPNNWLPILNNPGSYPTVALELKIDQLTTGALINYNSLINMEVASGLKPFNYKSLNNFSKNKDNDDKNELAAQDDDDSEDGDIRKQVKINSDEWDEINLRTIQVIKTLVSNFYKESNHPTTTVYAQSILNALPAYLANPALNRQYDPRMHHQIYKLQVRMLAQLITQLTSTNPSSTSVIYADPNRIVLVTPKITPSNALKFGEFLTTQLTSLPLFKYIRVTVDRVWDRMMWLDPANFSGILFNYGPPTQELGHDDMYVELAQEELIINFSVVHYLPSFLRGHVDMVISRLLTGLHSHRIKFLSCDNQSTTSLAKLTSSTDQVDWRSSEQRFGQQIIDADLGHRLRSLMPQVQDLLIQLVRAKSPDAEFPKLPNSPYHPDPLLDSQKFDPLIELVKLVAKLLLLDPRFQTEVERLVMDLFLLAGVNPYSHVARKTMGKVDSAKNKSKGGKPVKSEPQLVEEDIDEELKFPSLNCTYCGLIWQMNFYDVINEASQADNKVEESQFDEQRDVINSLGDDDDRMSLFSTKASNFIAEDMEGQNSVIKINFTGLRCPTCATEVTKPMIEFKLMQHVYQLTKLSQIADPQCMNCHTSSDSPLAHTCTQCNTPYPLSKLTTPSMTETVVVDLPMDAQPLPPPPPPGPAPGRTALLKLRTLCQILSLNDVLEIVNFCLG